MRGETAWESDFALATWVCLGFPILIQVPPSEGLEHLLVAFVRKKVNKKWREARPNFIIDLIFCAASPTHIAFSIHGCKSCHSGECVPLNNWSPDC